MSIREIPSYLEDSANGDNLRNGDSTFDISDSLSTVSLSTVDENKPFVSFVSGYLHQGNYASECQDHKVFLLDNSKCPQNSSTNLYHGFSLNYKD